MTNVATMAQLDFDQLRTRITRNPFNRWLGVDLIALDERGIVLAVKRRDELVGNVKTGVIHGGMMGVLIDTASSFSIIARTGQSVATIDYQVDIIRPCLEPELRIRGEAIHIGKTLSRAGASVSTVDGKLIATGRAAFVNTKLIE